MKRREFVTLLGASVAAWPLNARAQRSERIRRIGILSAGAEDPSQQARMAAFLNALHQAGWTEGRNLQSIIAVDWVTRPMCADTRRS